MLVAFNVVSPLPLPVSIPPTCKFLAIPTPPSTINAPLVVFDACVVLSILTVVVLAKFMLLPLSPLIVSSAKLPTLVILLSLKLVAPRLTLPVAVRFELPMSILPKPLVILPPSSAPVFCRLLLITFAPSVLALSTLVLLIRYSLVLTRLACSLKSQLSFALLQVMV